ncbi:Protein of unknown function [Bifidobacterium bohemicum]|uniref:DUF3710 domain-containing protein n=1 Tax=Bifidobacterium bohemicum DSM 22767 TaxID=1437606 RepID=A0A086ZG64_9BIFI|nr:DUF3710 domain-containing protein [Bifidobacterium bohemicum]KFI45514.1 hypothetical protein BBOH_1076 [Bifidobacterium bohemicum DSM 22767]SCB71686.1 Protein of unknown function [Bifidobacterium bohemicum]
MGLFGFGKKHAEKVSEKDVDDDETAKVEESGDQTAQGAGDDSDQTDQAGHADQSGDATDTEPEPRPVPEEPQEDYPNRGQDYGPWDINEEDGPDYDEYLDVGSYYLPFLQGIELRIKANRATGDVLGCTISYKSSSLEIEALAAPKTMSLWDGVREDLLAANPKASEKPGVFGMEVNLPIEVKGGKSVMTRIVGVDGPRWMLRGIFSGPAATQPRSAEAKALNQFFSEIVVDRGEEPLAPRDLIPMHPPVSPEQRRKAQAQAEEKGEGKQIPKRINGPFVADQETEVQTTISRGPMFSELR